MEKNSWTFRWRAAWRAAVRRAWRRCTRRRLEPRTEPRGRRSADLGMTLIEIMVVVAIMGLIAAAVVIAVLPRFRQAQVKTAEILVKKVQAAATEYYIQNTSQCPDSVAALKDYGITRESEKDPWGKELQITCDAANDLVEVRSSGKDGSFGNDDDVFYPQPEENR